MIKLVLYDVDGVLISQDQRFSEKFSREFNIPLEKLDKFFSNDLPAAMTGNADLLQVLPTYLADWGWKKSVEDLLSYWFTAENFLDIDMVESILKLKNRNIACGVISNQEQYRAAYLSEEMGLGELMDYQFYSCDLGSMKPSDDFWGLVRHELPEFNTQEILLWDDKNAVVASARAYGFNAELYTGFPNYQRVMKRYLD